MEIWVKVYLGINLLFQDFEFQNSLKPANGCSFTGCDTTAELQIRGGISRGSNGYARIDVRFPDKNDKSVQTR